MPTVGAARKVAFLTSPLNHSFLRAAPQEGSRVPFPMMAWNSDWAQYQEAHDIPEELQVTRRLRVFIGWGESFDCVPLRDRACLTRTTSRGCASVVMATASSGLPPTLYSTTKSAMTRRGARCNGASLRAS